MVRAHVKQPVEEKKPVTKKTANKKQKLQPSGVWPCKINGCNKEFAREADLKRHQRTTKLHMMPNSQPVQCPQCDATFTRTDALRRHQRSRHNGIVINPIDPLNSKDTEGVGEGSSTSAPQSRSGSPTMSKGKRNRNSSSANASSSTPVQTIVSRPDASGLSSGSQSYYRQNTINPVFVPPHTPNGVLDPSSYQSTQIPTSAARFHAWVPNPPWIQENPNMPRPTGPFTLIHPPPGYYAPGAYYRSPDGQPAMPMHAFPHGVVTMQVNPHPPISQPSANPHPPSEGNTNGNSNELSADSNDNIDPSLEALSSVAQETDRKEGTKERELVTGSFADTGLSAAVQKALQAVLAIDPSLNAAVAAAHAALPQTSIEVEKSAASPVDASSSSTPPVSTVALDQRLPSPPPPPTDRTDNAGDKNKDAGMDVDADGEADSDGDGPFQERQPDAALSENDSTMLPDGIKDLINEDSLSYAPPS